MEGEQFTEEEIQRLKELAKNLEATSRVSRIIKTTLLWVSSVIIAYLVIWENLLKGFWK
jgi:membrane protein YdbS with pleckstrin-like domain